MAPRLPENEPPPPTTTTETAQDTDTGEQVQQGPELCCFCMGESSTHLLEPCSHSGFCGTCAMLLTAGAVSDIPRCPICRGVIAGCHGASASITAVPTTASPTQPLVDTTTSVEEAIAQDILDILRSSTQTACHVLPNCCGNSRLAETTKLISSLT